MRLKRSSQVQIPQSTPGVRLRAGNNRVPSLTQSRLSHATCLHTRPLFIRGGSDLFVKMLADTSRTFCLIKFVPIITISILSKDEPIVLISTCILGVLIFLKL